MKFDVRIWRTFTKVRDADIRTWVEVDDPVTAALLVMDRFCIRSAGLIFVYEASSFNLCAQFTDVDLDAAVAPADSSLVSYDYSL